MKTENKILSIFSIIVLALILITVFSYRSINEVNDNAARVNHTREVSTELSDFFSLMQDAETGQRGFVITGKENFLEPYNLATEQYKMTINRLRELIKDNPIQKQKIDTLEQYSNLRLSYAQEVIILRKQNGFEAAAQSINTEKGKKLMDNIRKTLAEMRDEEERLLQERTKVTDESLSIAKIFVVSGGVLSITVVIFLVIFIIRGLRLEQDLIKAKQMAEKLVGFKDQFLANMSHEIRTPLNGIIGFTKILLRNGITPKQKHQLDAIKTSSDILLVLINDILDLAKIEAGKMTIETTELKLADLVNTILSTFELRIEEKELKVNKQYDKNIPNILLGDPIHINQILLNLLSNSVKFTKNCGQISISVNLLKQEEEKIHIEFIVSDTGIGIPAEKIETMFEPFTQSSSDTARRYGGTGLGLSIVKRLVDLMGGTISVKSKVHEGSAFTVTLPLKKTAATEVTKEKETVMLTADLHKLGKLKILLAEDIPVNQFLAQTILHDFGFESDTAENGKIAIELLEKNNYDIILMDLMMPEMNGWQATQHIRNKMQPPKSTIPIIALTADVTKKDMDKCAEVGMDDYVSKPINETDLLNKIVRLVKKPETAEAKKICNLDYLKRHSLNNPKFVTNIIQMFLKQTPAAVEAMNQCLSAADWNGLQGNLHKIRPSIDLIGLPKDIGTAVLQIKEYAREQEHLDLIPALLMKIEKALEQACKELEDELNKNPKS